MRQELDAHPAAPSEEAPASASERADGEAPLLVTFAVVDLAESSAVLASLGEEPVKASRAAYLMFLRSSVAGCSGRELWQRDDQALLAFDTPSAAVACAVAIQRAAERHNRTRADRLDVRVGIQLGEAAESAAVSDRGDFIARPAIQARQLCEATLGGHILVTDLVSTLAREDPAVSFERAGLADLTGAPEPVPTFEVRRNEAAVERAPLPPELVARPRGRCSFVGRTAEITQLRSTWAAATGGQRRLVFAMGEPGIGKSRLAAEFAAEAHASGGVVLSGRSFEESVVPYQPFVEALRQYVADCDPFELEAQLGHDPAPLVTLVPELAARLPARAGDDRDDGERYRLFDAVAALLSAISQTSPLLLVLDDLQWADPATLLLLKHVVLDPRPASMLILGLYRDTEVPATHDLVGLQADVERDYVVERVPLGGLEDADISSMFDEMVGWSPPVIVAHGLREETEGNPFFLQEVIHQLDESGSLADRERLIRGHLVPDALEVPDRVRTFVARRMQRLSAGTLEVLEVAAVVGTEFEIDILASILSVDPDSLVDNLEEAIEARLVVEVSGRAGMYAFAHALFQQTLHEGQGTNRRASLHARVADAIEMLHPDDPAALSDLARHYALTAGRYAEKVVYYGGAAGDRAYAQLAYEDAMLEYTRALDALPLVRAPDQRTKPDLLVRLGEAQTRVGDSVAAKRSFLAAAEHCVGVESYDLLARAALGYGGTGKFGSIFDPFQVVNGTLVSLLERAIALCPSDQEPTRIRLLGWLAQALYWSDDVERRHALSQEALDAARRIDDPRALAHALHSRHVALWGVRHLPELRAAAEEMLALGQSLGDRDIQLKAYTWLITDALKTDPIAVVDAYIAGYAGLAEELHRPYLLGYAESMRAARAHLDGRYDDMTASMTAQLSHSEGVDVFRAQEAHRWQMGLLMLDLGRIDDALMDIISDCAATYPGLTFEVMLVLADATVGRSDEARTRLAALVAPSELASIPTDCMWDGSMAMLSRAVARLGAVEYAGPLYELLLPYADRTCVWGSGFIIFGPTSRLLGMLATTMGDADLALTHLEDALRRCHDLDSAPLVARTKTEQARALLARNGEGDEGRARSLLEEARVTATRLGMPQLARDVEELLPSRA